jgi:hypothetical protein
MARLGALPMPSVVVKLVLLSLGAMTESPAKLNNGSLVEPGRIQGNPRRISWICFMNKIKEGLKNILKNYF